ncbi:MAG: YhcH/YjgK/YiaL family protein [Candidatus Andersenbacteria bacterium]|nr:YhcH/YjgK/YiaL family protein [Candidatus Andersenbacteria bacterium]MBI3251147.1 YhcH/YjgK/YiaL family protein [Candidatus Andersenbacteria bacterium]
MTTGHIDHPEIYKKLLPQPVWQEVLSWITTEASQKPDGEYEIRGRDLYASITTIETRPRSITVFEAHREYIDLHFCLEGEEVIDWTSVDKLVATMKFDIKKDYCLYQSTSQFNSIDLTAGAFAVFLPTDAHRPKVSDSKNKLCRKVVVKILTKLV